MSDLNNATFTGRLTRDAEQKTLSTGTQLVTFDIACNTGFGDYAKTLYITVNLWGKSGNGVFPYLNKGVQVGVSGEVELQQWTSKQDGSTQKKLCLSTATPIVLFSRPNGHKTEQPEPTPPNPNIPDGDGISNDIPF